MLDKTVASLEEAVSGIADGATILCGGFAGSGIPTTLLLQADEAVDGLGQKKIPPLPPLTRGEPCVRRIWFTPL